MLNFRKQRNNQRGFTLVELLVVVAIIAILAVIGLTLFSGAQTNARDARRKSDIDAIVAALESKRQPGSVFYTTLTNSDFASGSIPADTTTAKYSIRVYTADNGALTDPNPTTWDAANAVPNSNFKQATTSDGFSNTSFPASTEKSFKLCARLESSTQANLILYCKNSAQ